jgi:hypothetical protein
LLLLILAACAGALVAWRISRYQEPSPLELEEPGSSTEPPVAMQP